jgi:putative transcriptional regulator
MKTVRMKIDTQQLVTTTVGRIDARRVDATTEADIDEHTAVDDSNAKLDASLNTADHKPGCTNRGG